MSQNYSCDCKRKTCRHQIATAENGPITFSQPPSSPEADISQALAGAQRDPSPELPHLTEADILQALAEAQREREERAEQEDNRHYGSPPPDGQPMIFDENANDDWISDPEGLVQ